jgi:hypothetical protein
MDRAVPERYKGEQSCHGGSDDCYPKSSDFHNLMFSRIRKKYRASPRSLYLFSFFQAEEFIDATR